MSICIVRCQRNIFFRRVIFMKLLRATLSAFVSLRNQQTIGFKTKNKIYLTKIYYLEKRNKSVWQFLRQYICYRLYCKSGRYKVGCLLVDCWISWHTWAREGALSPPPLLLIGRKIVIPLLILPKIRKNT